MRDLEENGVFSLLGQLFNWNILTMVVSWFESPNGIQVMFWKQDIEENVNTVSQFREKNIDFQDKISIEEVKENLKS